MDSPPTAVFDALNLQQESGLACVVCNAPFHVPPAIEHVSVGASTVGRRVFACDTAECAVAVGYVPAGERLELEAGR